MSQLTIMMSKRSTRLNHLLWHSVRVNWEHMTAEERLEVPKGWEPPRPSLDKDRKVLWDNGAGIDFLYMHRQMVIMAQEITAEHNEKLVVWDALPAIDDDRYPVPAYFPEVYRAKQPKVWEDWLGTTSRLVEPCSLKKISINTLGTTIEFGIHAALHTRFGGPSANGHVRHDAHRIPSEHNLDFNEPGYDTLLDSYSAHVHPLFWGIHTWIDAQIDAWEIANDTKVEWGTPWLGAGMHSQHNHAMGMSDGRS